MNNNKAPEQEVVLNERRAGDVRATDLASAEHGSNNRRFGLMDLWSIRRNAREFKIHNRISRL